MFRQRLYNILLVVFFCAISSQALLAQTYGNEWINYSKSYYKIKVPKTGLYRITYQALSNAPGLSINSIQGSRFNLFHNGQVVPFYVTTTGILGANDYIEFYGEKNDGSLDANLYDDPSWHMNEYYSLFNDTAAYYLTWDTPEPNILINNVTNDLTNLPAKEIYCTTKTVQSFNNTYQQGNYALLSGAALYEAKYDEGEGYSDVQFDRTTKSYTFNTNGYYNSSAVSCQLRLAVVSTSTTEHRLIVNFNSLQLKDTTFYGYKLNKWNFSFPASSILTNSVLNITAAGTGTRDRNAVAFIELTYPNTFNFQGNSRFNFSINDAPVTKYLEINNFSSSSSAPILYDLTNHIRIVGTPGQSPLRFKLPAGGGGQQRDLYLTSQALTDITLVNSISLVSFVNFNNPVNQGNYIILSHKSLQNDGQGNNWLNNYSQHRSSAAGGSFSPIIVTIDQLHEQFSNGIEKHPLAIRRFAEFARDKWIFEPRFMFIIGKGREYANSTASLNMRINSSAYAQCLIPTFGFPGGDNLLTAEPGSMVPTIPTGRLSVTNASNIGIYLTKVIDYEAEQAKVGDPYQTIAEKLWMKEFMHLGGGNNTTEQQTFKFYLDSYEELAEDTFYGANIISYYKNSTNPIQIAQSGYLGDRIDEGVSLITFFGHASPNSFDFSIDDPNNYSNFKRYHVVLSNGCYSGNLYNPAPGVSESFIFAENRGAVAFIATTALSSSVGLNNFSRNLYENLSNHQYNKPLGEVIQSTIADMQVCCNSSFNRMVAQDMTLHGDPALYLNTHDKPDYDLEPQMIFFDPPTVTVETDSFTVNVIVTNLGKAIDEDITLEVIRTLPDGTSFTYTKNVKATYYQDTIPVTIVTGSAEAFGLNNLKITIDAEDVVTNELSETNNTLGLTLNILSEDVFPIHPYEFAIVPNQGVTLKASTANAFAGTRNYVMEIDTTELFNSPAKRSTSITQSGGVLKWQPQVTYQDSVVYYWRVGIDSAGAGPTKWRYSSFIYLNGEFPGWNQSHYYQWLKDQYSNLELDVDRVFKFADDNKDIDVKTGTWEGYGGPLPWDQIAYYLNNVRQQYWNCGGSGFTGGLTFAVFDPVTGNNWKSLLSLKTVDPISGYNINDRYKSIHCGTIDVGGFMFPTNQPYWQDRISNFIDSIPAGHYVLIYSVNNTGYANWGANLINHIQDLGANAISTLQNQSPNSPWIFFAQKGNPASAEEVFGNSINDVLDFSTTITANWYEGQTETPLIGPAFEWGSVHWDYFAMEQVPNDQSSIDVIGVDRSGVETVLIPGLTALDQIITNTIDANTYPYLKLRLNTRDDSTRTPTQLKYWRVLYKKVPEAALNAFTHFEFVGDTVTLGESLRLSVAVENVTDIDMDSLLVKYTISTASRNVVTDYVRYDSLKALQTVNLDYQFNTNCGCLGELNSLVVEVNPDEDQPEQFHFNNIGILQFGIAGDNANPLLDVTFDNVHILDGDIVSAEPEILIKLKDENKYLALDDTSLVNIFLKHPDGDLERILFNDPDVQFIPVVPSQVSKNNTAEVIINKRFEEDGTYELLVQAKDRSDNISGTYGNSGEGIDYRISFEVVNQAMLTNVLTYPNPFTTSTRFVFTLTGSELPTFFKIQILTVTGKVVREIMLDELGPIHIGRNITEFAWDGTDQYGDPLGNGLYLYRVVAKLNGESLDKMDTGTDKYFKSGLGKMYLAR